MDVSGHLTVVLICVFLMTNNLEHEFLKDFIYLFLDRGGGRERVRNIGVQEKH